MSRPSLSSPLLIDLQERHPQATAPPRRLAVARPCRVRPLWGVVGLRAALPLGLALRVAEAVTLLVYWLAVPLRRVGLTNLAIAFPDRPLAERKRILARRC